ncbi:hypothetical protein MSG28_013516 [Choristoneura fumiferana]|uniref:Uncharacterized protein n=1 Tax=Choristoneura fumiferana TaxID=7141 RepID=A0ACC0K806_CHOFU|nr:hypothetical protein MSG28_013516 [Choristoneura fumiferana]
MSCFGRRTQSRRHLSGLNGQSESSSSSEDDEGSSSLPPNKRRRCDRGYVPVDPRVDSLVNQTDSDDKKVVPPANEERLRKVTKLQHFNTQAWKGLKYKSILQGFSATPGFVALKELINWAARNPSELNPASLLEKATSLLGPGSPLHKCSERKMQVICGRRGECIEIRRERILKEVNNINLKTSLREIPPSAEYLFSRDALQPLIQSLGGFHTWLNRPSYIKEKGQSRDRSSTYKQDRRNRNNGQENRNPGQDNKAKQGGSQTFQKRNNFRNKGNYTGKKNFTNQDKQKGRIPFKKKPPLQHLTQNMLNRFTTRTSPEMSAIIKDLKEKAVLEVPPVLNSSFLSKMFLIKKADGSMRPIFDLRGLNQYVATKHFQDSSSIFESLLQPRSATTNCTTIWPVFSPPDFCSSVKLDCRVSTKEGIRLLVYLDDYILANQDKDKLAEQVMETLSTLENLGWQVNYQKSVLTPTQQLEYLGLSWNTQQVTMALPISKVQKPNNTPRRLHCRQTQRFLKNLMKCRPRERKPLPRSVQMELHWWQRAIDNSSVEMHRKEMQQIPAGCSPQRDLPDGEMVKKPGSWHSNLKELYAVYGAISRHQQRLGNAHILVQADVTVERHDLGGGSPGRYNGIADRLSRNRPVPEWHLLPPASEAVFRIWGVPEVDLFASSESAVVDRYVTWDSRDGSAIFCDAFSRPWKFKLAWVFPPPNLIPRVLRHLNMAVGTYIVIAPHWMQCFWLADLRARALAEPYPIHNLHNNLIDLTTGRAPPQIIKAISLTRPQEKKVGIWDTKLLFDWLRDTPSTDRLFDVSRRTAIVLLLASGRRVHDLTLLDIAEDSFFENRDNELELWPRFGSKTDSGKSRQSEASRVATESDDSADKVTSTLKSCLPLPVLPKSLRKPPSDVKAGFKVESDGLPLLPLGDVDEEAYAVPWPAEPPLPDNYQHPEAKLLIAVKLLSAGFDPNALYTMCWFEAEAQMQYIPSGDDDSADERFRFNMLPTWAVKLLLNAGASVACINSVGYTPLHLCLRNKIEELLEVLLYYNCGDAESSLRVQVVDNRGYSVLKTAVELNWLPGVCLALEAGADASSSFDHLDQQARREMKTTLVHLAVKGRNMRILDKVLSIAEQENLIDCLNTEGDTPLCVAIRNGHIECAKSLLHRGAGIENMSRNYCNALHIAAMYGRIDIMKYLLESVSDSKYLISVFNKAGLAPIHLAANNNNYECVQLLLKHGNCQRLATTLPDDTFSTALHLAAQHDYVEVAKAIISKDPMAVKDFNNRGFLPLHEAAFHCSNKTMLFFLHETEAVLSSYTAGTHENKQTAIQLITAQLPNPADFFETLFDSFMHYEQKQGQPEISVNYGFLTTRSHNMTQIQVIEEMVRCGPRRILLHPLMESLLHLKWKTLLPFFYVMLTIYGVFVTALNTYVVTYFHFCDRNATIYGSTPKIFDYTFWVFAAFIYTTISLMLILETFFITVKKRRYFMNFETWIKLSCMALVGVVPLAFKLVPKEVDWPRHVATAALLLAWLQMLFLLSRFPNWGYYVLMFGEVAANIFKILLTFVFLIIGFSLSFMIQYRSQDPFSNSWTAFVKTTVMMTQEFEYDDLFDEKHTAILGLSTEVARFLFALFLMFVGIVLMNFMVGVAVSNVNELNVAGNTKRLEKQVELLITLDYLVYGLVSKVFPINTYYKRYHWSINNFPSKEKLWRIRYYFDFDDSMSHDDEYIPSHLRRAIIKKAMEQCKNAKEETNKDTFEKKIDVLYESLVAPVDEKDKNGKENTKLDRVLEHLMSLTEDIANMKEQIRGLKEVSNKKPRRGRKLKRDASRSHSRSRRRAPEELYDKMNLVLQDIKELKRTPQLPDSN